VNASATETSTKLRSLLFYSGAIAVSFMFWSSGIAKLAHFGATLGEMAHFGLNPTWLFAAGTIVIQLAGSALLIFGGRYAWLGAAALALFTLASIPLAHDFWNMPKEIAFGERLIAEEHISVIGGLIVAAVLAREMGPQWQLHKGARS
jgi:transmembrane protein